MIKFSKSEISAESAESREKRAERREQRRPEEQLALLPLEFALEE
jgi:hypothetical protein